MKMVVGFTVPKSHCVRTCHWLNSTDLLLAAAQNLTIIHIIKVLELSTNFIPVNLAP